MIILVLAYKKKQQKNRSYIPYSKAKLKFGDSAVVAVSSGFLGNRMIQSFFIRFKKMFKLLKSITKFWLYLSVFYIFSKKPLNVRMGKGKGSRKGLLCLVKSGNSIVELKYCRFGLLLKLKKYISVRCSFKVNLIFSGYTSLSKYNLNIHNCNFKVKNIKKIISRYCIDSRISEILDIYRKSSNIKRNKHVKRLYNRFYFKGKTVKKLKFRVKKKYWRNLRYFIRRKRGHKLIYWRNLIYSKKMWKNFKPKLKTKKIKIVRPFPQSIREYVEKNKKTKVKKKFSSLERIVFLKKNKESKFEDIDYFFENKRSVGFALLRYRLCFKKSFELPFIKKIITKKLMVNF